MKKIYVNPYSHVLEMGTRDGILDIASLDHIDVHTNQTVDASVIEVKAQTPYNVWDDDWSEQ